MDHTYIRSAHQRQSNIELLRIIAMFMIVAHHIAVHSGFIFSSDSITANRLWIQFIQMGGKIGVNIFVLISGYFGITTSSIKGNKVIRLWLQIFTYSAFFFLINLMLLHQSFGINDLLKSFLPISFSAWWFASTYFILYILSPFINQFFNSLSQKAYLKTLLLLTILWCILPTFISQNMQSNPLLWFVFLYALSGYLRLHLNISKYKSKLCFIYTGILILLTYLSAVIFDILGTKFSFFSNHATYFYDMQKLPVFLVSVLLFLGFLNLKISYKPIINVISSATFGVYLIHENMYIRYFLWKTLFKNQAYNNSSFLIIYTLLQIIIVFVICTLIELFRIYVIEKIYIKRIDNCLNFAKQFGRKCNSHKILRKIKELI